MGIQSSEKSDDVQIAEIVGLLNGAEPSRIAQLNTAYPEYRDALRPGLPLGRQSSRQVQFLISVAREGVDAALTMAERCAATVHSRLSVARKIEFVVQSFSIVSSSGTLLLLIQNPARAVIAAVVSFAASIASVGLTLYRSGISGSKSNLISVYTSLVSSISEATFLRGRLLSYDIEELEDAQARKAVVQLVEHAERLCKNIRQWAGEVAGSSL